MIVLNADLAEEALDKTLEVREEAGLPFGTPVNVYDMCEKLTPKVRVRFADYSMEGVLRAIRTTADRDLGLAAARADGHSTRPMSWGTTSSVIPG